MLLSYKNEREIIDLAASQDDRDVCFYPVESDIGHRLLASLRGKTLSQRERPDFEDLKHQMLIEVMIVDDHPRPNGKDSSRAREAVLLKEAEEAGLAEIFPNASLTAIANTGLPTDRDHNFQAYLRQFAQVVDKHAHNEGVYRGQRPGLDLAFVFLDESTAYVETLGAFARDGRARPHFHFADRAFLNVLEGCGADCAAWLAPYKYMPADTGLVPMPTLTIIDIHELNGAEHEHFDARRMRSTEA